MASEKLIPLKDAPWAFAPRRLRSEALAAGDVSNSSKSSGSGPTSYETLGKLISEDPAAAAKIVGDSIGGILKSLQSPAPEIARQEYMLELLRIGKLEAYGVETAPERKRDLEILPPHLFIDAKISWTKNIVTSLGATYEAVQVRRRISTNAKGYKISDPYMDISRSAASPDTEEALAEARSTVADISDHEPVQERHERPRHKPGPPSGADVVISAYKELHRTGAIKDGMTIKDICRKLVRFLQSNTQAFPNRRGLSYASIARHLRPYLTGLSKFSS